MGMMTGCKLVISDDMVGCVVLGDQEARDKLVSTCLPRIWRTVFLACGKDSDTEDLVQNTMLQILEKLHSYRGPNTFQSWVDRITMNVVRMHYRKKSLWLLRTATNKFDNLYIEAGSAPDRKIEIRQMFMRLAEHMSRIKPKNRVALMLSSFYGYSAEEIAEMTGCAPATAQKRSRRGYLELQARTKKDPSFQETLKELVP